ncbi:MAG: OmpH family outer membrane protein [Candidatus Brocadiaceae bacterium]|nr:OmpH family outer membrane protein [Candidatus Brocadiaceae bacterium]
MERKKFIIESCKKSSVAYVFLAVCVAFCVCSLSVCAESSSAAGIKVGVVDINKVFEKYEKRKKFDEELKKQEKEYQAAINDKKKELVGLNDKIQLLDLGSDARRKYEETFEKKNMELESYAKFAEKNIMKRYKGSFENLYTDVLKGVEEVGQGGQYDLIIKKEETELKGGGLSELQFKVGIKTVLYHSAAVDITNQVIDVLNKNFQK